MARTRHADEVLAPRTIGEDPVVQAIIRAISLKRIRPGAKLGEVQLAKAFDVNRIHVRHVLAYLGSKGIVTQIPNRGAYVSEPSADEARQVFQTRKILERAAIEALVPRLTPQRIREIRAHIQHEAGDGKADRWDTLSLTGDFHALLARLSGNEVLAKMLDELILRTSLIIAAFERASAADCSPDAHPHIAELIVAGDVAAAVSENDAHLTAMESRLPIGVPSAPAEDIGSIFAELRASGENKPRRKTSKKSNAAAAL